MTRNKQVVMDSPAFLKFHHAHVVAKLLRQQSRGQRVKPPLTLAPFDIFRKRQREESDPHEPVLLTQRGDVHVDRVRHLFMVRAEWIGFNYLPHLVAVVTI